MLDPICQKCINILIQFWLINLGFVQSNLSLEARIIKGLKKFVKILSPFLFIRVMSLFVSNCQKWNSGWLACISFRATSRISTCSWHVFTNPRIYNFMKFCYFLLKQGRIILWRSKMYLCLFIFASASKENKKIFAKKCRFGIRENMSRTGY